MCLFTLNQNDAHVRAAKNFSNFSLQRPRPRVRVLGSKWDRVLLLGVRVRVRVMGYGNVRVF